MATVDFVGDFAQSEAVRTGVLWRAGAVTKRFKGFTVVASSLAEAEVELRRAAPSIHCGLLLDELTLSPIADGYYEARATYVASRADPKAPATFRLMAPGEIQAQFGPLVLVT